MFEPFFNYGATFLNYLVQQLFYCTLIFLLVYPIIRFCRSSFPALSMCLCWLVIIRFLLPVKVTSNWIAWPWLDASLQLPLRAADYFVPSVSGHDGIAQVHGVHYDSEHYLWAIVFLVVILTAVRNVYSLLNCRRVLSKLAARGVPVNHQITLMVKPWLDRYSIARPVRVLCSEQASFVYTIGSFRPKIVLPQDVVKNNSLSDLEKILAHELAHIKRFDDFSIVFLSLLRSFLFFFPPVVICIHEMTRCREQLCDREVLSQQCFNAYDYGNSLLNIAAQYSNSGTEHVVAQLTGASLLSDRIRYFKRKNSKQKTQPLLSVAILTGLLIIILPLNSHSRFSGQALQSSHYVLPVSHARLASAYGYRVMPLGKHKGKKRLHHGVDFAARAGTPIVAVSAGLIVEAIEDFENSASPGNGKLLIIQHADGVQSRYMHLQELSVDLGDSVKAGQTIALMGSSGLATGPHLHFEVLKNDKHIDPASLIDFELLQ